MMSRGMKEELIKNIERDLCICDVRLDGRN